MVLKFSSVALQVLILCSQSHDQIQGSSAEPLQPEMVSRQCPAPRDRPGDGILGKWCENHVEEQYLLLSSQRLGSTLTQLLGGSGRAGEGPGALPRAACRALGVWGSRLSGWWLPGSSFSWKICFTGISSSLFVPLFAPSACTVACDTVSYFISIAEHFPGVFSYLLFLSISFSQAFPS